MGIARFDQFWRHVVKMRHPIRIVQEVEEIDLPFALFEEWQFHLQITIKEPFSFELPLTIIVGTEPEEEILPDDPQTIEALDAEIEALAISEPTSPRLARLRRLRANMMARLKSRTRNSK